MTIDPVRLLLWIVILWSQLLCGQAEQPRITISENSAPSEKAKSGITEPADQIAEVIRDGDVLDEEKLDWLFPHREAVIESLSREFKVSRDEDARLRLQLWLAVLGKSSAPAVTPTADSLKVTEEIAEYLPVLEKNCPFEDEELSRTVQGGNLQLASAAARVASSFQRQACIPAIRKKVNDTLPAEVQYFSRPLSELQPEVSDVTAIEQRIRSAEHTQDKVELLRGLSWYTLPEATSATAGQIIENQILENPELQGYLEILPLWAESATGKSAAALETVLKSLAAEESGTTRSTGELWTALARTVSPERLREIFQALPEGIEPMNLLRGVSARATAESFPELTPVLEKWLEQRRMGLNSAVVRFLHEHCGEPGRKSAILLALDAKDPGLSLAAHWYSNNLTLPAFVEELSSAGLDRARLQTGLKTLRQKVSQSKSNPIPESDLVFTLLLESGLATEVLTHAEYIPVEYPGLLFKLGDLGGEPLKIVDWDQSVDGIEQLANVDPKTLEVPKSTRLRYNVTFLTRSLKVEYHPADRYDAYDLETTLEAFNQAADRLSVPERYGRLKEMDPDTAVILFAPQEKVRVVLEKYGLLELKPAN